EGTGYDALAFIRPQIADHRLVGHILRRHQRDLALEAKVRPLLEQPCSVRAGLHREDDVWLHRLDPAQVRTEVGRAQRMPELASHRAAAFGEDLNEAARLLVAEGVVLSQRRNP